MKQSVINNIQGINAFPPVSILGDLSCIFQQGQRFLSFYEGLFLTIDKNELTQEQNIEDPLDFDGGSLCNRAGPL